MKTTKQFCATFRTETDALRFEREAQTRGVPGRIAPAPRQLNASCGKAWLAPAEAEMNILRLLAELEIDFGMATTIEWRGSVRPGA